MQIRVITLRYSEGIQGFPEDSLRRATFGREVLAYGEALEWNLSSLRETFVSGSWRPGGFRQFKIRDPKTRGFVVRGWKGNKQFRFPLAPGEPMIRILCHI